MDYKIVYIYTMMCPHVWLIIHSLKRGDYLPYMRINHDNIRFVCCCFSLFFYSSYLAFAIWTFNSQWYGDCICHFTDRTVVLQTAVFIQIDFKMFKQLEMAKYGLYFVHYVNDGTCNFYFITCWSQKKVLRDTYSNRQDLRLFLPCLKLAAKNGAPNYFLYRSLSCMRVHSDKTNC